MPGTVLADTVAILGPICEKDDDMDSDEEDDDKLLMVDNAISTLNKVVCFQQGVAVPEALTGSLLALLPLTSDIEEA